MGEDAALIDRFLEMMAAERGASRNTLLAYRADLEGAGSLLNGLSLATKDAIAELAAAWAELAASSVARKASALRAFYGFLEEEGLRADNPSSALPRPVTRRALPKILSAQEVDSLFALIEQKLAVEHPAPLDLRLSALIELLYGSGLRATELMSLPRRALAADRPFLILKGKGARERLVPISDRARAAVAAWLAHVPADSPWLFPSGKSHVSIRW
jgi:integrase/recombinase XerD